MVTNPPNNAPYPNGTYLGPGPQTGAHLWAYHSLISRRNVVYLHFGRTSASNRWVRTQVDEGEVVTNTLRAGPVLPRERLQDARVLADLRTGAKRAKARAVSRV